MNWTLNWLLSGGIAFALAIVNLIRVSGGKTAGCQALMFCSMSGGVPLMGISFSPIFV